MKFCQCGTAYRKRCPRCKSTGRSRTQTTTEQGYGWDHQQITTAYRKEHPLCEACVMRDVLTAKPAKELHHIKKIADAPQLRLHWSNWLALCVSCHKTLENDRQLAEMIKKWSQKHYQKQLHGGGMVTGDGFLSRFA